MVPERFSAGALGVTVVQGLVEKLVDQDEIFADRLLRSLWVSDTVCRETRDDTG